MRTVRLKVFADKVVCLVLETPERPQCASQCHKKRTEANPDDDIFEFAG